MKNRLIVFTVMSVAVGTVVFGAAQAQAQQMQISIPLYPESAPLLQPQIDFLPELTDSSAARQIMREAIDEIPPVSFRSWQDVVARIQIERAINGAS